MGKVGLSILVLGILVLAGAGCDSSGVTGVDLKGKTPQSGLTVGQNTGLLKDQCAIFFLTNDFAQTTLATYADYRLMNGNTVAYRYNDWHIADLSYNAPTKFIIEYPATIGSCVGNTNGTGCALPPYTVSGNETFTLAITRVAAYSTNSFGDKFEDSWAYFADPQLTLNGSPNLSCNTVYNVVITNAGGSASLSSTVAPSGSVQLTAYHFPTRGSYLNAASILRNPFKNHAYEAMKVGAKIAVNAPITSEDIDSVVHETNGVLPRDFVKMLAHSYNATLR